jgi:uncharacterized protein YabE (DUF348 family)
LQTCASHSEFRRSQSIEIACFVPHVQKGAVLIVNDQTSASLITASALALTFFFTSPSAANAAVTATPPIPVTAAAAAAAADGTATTSESISVIFSYEGRETSVPTSAHTVAAFLAERDVRVAPEDFVSAPLETPLVDGMPIAYRPAIDVTLTVGKSVRTVRTAAPTVAELLAEQRIGIGAYDQVTPSVTTPLGEGTANVAVRVSRVDAWTARVHRAIAPKTVRRSDVTLAADTSRIVDPGRPGERETTVRYVRRDDGRTTSTILASRIVREPRAKIIARGVAAYASFARVAEQSFSNVVRMAGSALHMMATAYTAGCYGCSGITASGIRAGFGIIAVDPNVIPLGTHLFIPGYGRAIAGDTGGAIQGHRIDLGFNSNGEAMRWGSRPVTVYVLR